MSKKKPRPTPVPAKLCATLSDAHTHLGSCAAKAHESVAAIIDRARVAGVATICTVGDGLAEAEQALAIAQEFEDVFAACAIHPTRALELDDHAKARLEDLVADPCCVAVGETGLDTYWIQHAPDETAPLEVQIEALHWHRELAVKHAKALMIHNREADQELLRELALGPQPQEVILHCFSSPLEVAEEALSRGYMLSFAGNATFKRNDYLREAARIAPLENLLVETDAPYMTPEPFRGARNEPALIGHTFQVLAQARDMDVAEFAEQIAANVARVYGLPTGN